MNSGEYNGGEHAGSESPRRVRARSSGKAHGFSTVATFFFLFFFLQKKAFIQV